MNSFAFLKLPVYQRKKITVPVIEIIIISTIIFIIIKGKLFNGNNYNYTSHNRNNDNDNNIFIMININDCNNI